MAKSSKGVTLNNLAKRFSDETRAREMLEAIRWPNGVACPRCGSLAVSKIESKAVSQTRPGVYRCKDCRKMKKPKQFTVTVGTIFEDSHIPLSKWLLAISLLCASKKGMSAHQLHRMLGITYKSAWFMAHRIRYAMQAENQKMLTGIVEADETYIGVKARGVGSGNVDNKTPVIALVQRNGEVRSFAVPTVSAQTLREALLENVSTSSHIMTDELPAYKKIGKQLASHETVVHSAYEYVRGDVSTNSVEGFFGLLKRGINGVYHHVSKEHLNRYLAEFNFRYNRRKLTDDETTIIAVSKFEGKRLKYRDSLA